MDIPAAIAAQTAITQQNVALSVTKQAAQADQAVAQILEESVQASKNRGTNVDILV